ncbi:Type I restriction-modification system, specificity subunit S [Acinetobacter junii CIP 107470 = MTCC 11364]|uniref:Type I restriction-modification system, specificity subunit S n=1 Tax=Acinetobacter junii CIP 107470 = MTCC 11364 TaxID=1217666 RepID=S7WVM4_ACIJU|nr:restriction endonuclease subunit S [Acinetobacter junii]ENV51093.1 hypothetical protein F953_01504 [Acinetobacter junii CIP 107470 = MTCC 11364]EPR86032.1 Type I restriction-modification system, specificity subunit S [Acinetobacter junii CIP 107470 = MTCC 11364]
MEFKQYPSYKKSGVEWLGEVPEHWNLKRFCYLFAENKKKNIGLKETNVLSLSYGNIKEKKIDDNKGLLPESFETYQIIEPNDIVFRFTDLQNDKRSLRSAISKYHGIITSAYIAVKTKQNADFYNYLFRAYDLQKVFYSMGEGMRQSLKMDELNKMPVVLPSEDEQKRIVAFLDTETTRIDTLIAKQEKLIELLEEQRKSIISHAVTKGLNPNAPMKDSGVEWLGEVPEHWEVKKIKRISPVNRGASPRPINDLKYFDDNGEYAWVRISDVTRSNGFLFETEQRLSSLGASFSVKLEPESLFLSIAATVGKPCITKIKTCIHDGFVYFPNLNKHRDLLFNIFESKLCFVGLGKLGTQLNLNSETVEDIYVAIPPESEEKAILGYIQTETTRIDNLISKQKSLIEKLKEYRSSIISHAVTGKIDIREFC